MKLLTTVAVGWHLCTDVVSYQDLSVLPPETSLTQLTFPILLVRLPSQSFRLR